MNCLLFTIACEILLLHSMLYQIWCTSSTVWIRSHRLAYIRSKCFRDPDPPLKLSREQRVALCAEILDYRIFTMNAIDDEKTKEILEHVDLYKNNIFEDGFQNRIPCINEEKFQLHVVVSSSMPHFYYIYVRFRTLASDPVAYHTIFELFSIAEPKAIASSLTHDAKELEKSFLDTINNIVTNEDAYVTINYDICEFDPDHYLRLCSSAFNAISSASDRKVLNSEKMSLGCWRNPVYFLFERTKNKKFVTNNVKFPLVSMLTCEPSPDVKFYVVADLNERGSVFLLKDCPPEFDFVRDDIDNDSTYVHVTAHVRSLPVLLY